MYQIDSSGSVIAQPTPAAAGTPGWFTGGNPATGTPATILDADWFNALQAELLAILSAASITPVKGTNNQVLAAIQARFSAQSQTFGIGQTYTDVTATRALNTTYTNSTGKPIVVYVFGSTTANTSAMGLVINGAESAVSFGATTAIAIGVTGVVPAGATYSIITTGSVSFSSWKELR
jgi:hypothetical protein